MADNPGAEAPPTGLPEAVVGKGRRGVSIIWLIPLVAGAIAIWLAYTTISEQGPTITITFETAEGIEAGKTKIKYRDVVVGLVDTIAISDDRSHVVVSASMEKRAVDYLHEGTQFWVVRPRFSASGISGLGTLVSGAFIEVEPGTGESRGAFKGLEIPPVVRSDSPGAKFILLTQKLGSIGAHSPIFFRGIQVGEVLGHEFADDHRSIRIHAFVRAPFHELVRDKTRFWDAGGIDISTGAEGFKIKVESLTALLAGGVAFETLGGVHAGRQAEAGTEFPLFESRESSREFSITEKIPYLLYFDGSVRGLKPGAPVEFRGVRVGTVSDVRFRFALATNAARIAVTIQIEPQRIMSDEDVRRQQKTGKRYEVMAALVSRGLRAQLQTASFITGQQLVALDINPDRRAKQLKFGGEHPEIPTIPSSIKEIMDSVTRILTKLEKLPLDVVIADMRGVISQDLAKALREIAAASRSIRLLAEELQRRPESLIRGKGGR